MPKLPFQQPHDDVEYSDDEEAWDDAINTKFLDSFIDKTRQLRQHVHDAAKENITEAQRQQKDSYNKRHATCNEEVAVGQKVLLLNKKNVARVVGKFELPKKGPYTVVEICDSKRVKLQNENGVVLKTKYPYSQIVPFKERRKNEGAPAQGKMNSVNW